MTRRGGCRLSLEEFVGILTFACRTLDPTGPATHESAAYPRHLNVTLSLLTPSQLGLRRAAREENHDSEAFSAKAPPSKLYLILSWHQNPDVSRSGRLSMWSEILAKSKKIMRIAGPNAVFPSSSDKSHVRVVVSFLFFTLRPIVAFRCFTSAPKAVKCRRRLLGGNLHSAGALKSAPAPAPCEY